MRSDNLQLRIQLRATVQSTLNDIMQTNQISATDMEEAIEHYLLSLKEAANAELLNQLLKEKNDMEEAFVQLQQQITGPAENLEETIPEMVDATVIEEE